jgi:adenylate cyclase
MSIPGFGPITASAMAATIRDASNAAASRPELSSAHCVLACSLVRLGRKEEAQRAVLEMQQSLPASGSNNLKQFRFADAGGRKQISVALGEAGWNEK